MIARVRAWLDRSGPTSAAWPDDLALAVSRARIAELEQQLSTEQMTTARLEAQLKLRTAEGRNLNNRLDNVLAELEQVRADHTFVAAERCECGGDTELYWRRRAVAAERDRANAIALTEEVARLRLIADEAERLHHIVEQIEHPGRVTA